MKDLIILLVFLFIIVIFFLIQKRKFSDQALFAKEKENDTNYHYRDYDPPPVEKYWSEIKKVPIKALVELLYENADEEINRRIVRISSYDGSAYLNCFCELRDEPRTFRIDRIQEAVDVETGELIENLPDWLEKKYQQTPHYLISTAFSNLRDEVDVLFYMGKADGRLMAAERDIIYTFAREITEKDELTDQKIEEYLKTLAIPSYYSFKLAFGRICEKSPAMAKKVMAASEAIVHTQKKIHPAEKKALDYMATMLAPNKSA